MTTQHEGYPLERSTPSLDSAHPDATRRNLLEVPPGTAALVPPDLRRLGTGIDGPGCVE